MANKVRLLSSLHQHLSSHLRPSPLMLPHSFHLPLHHYPPSFLFHPSSTSPQTLPFSLTRSFSTRPSDTTINSHTTQIPPAGSGADTWQHTIDQIQSTLSTVGSWSRHQAQQAMVSLQEAWDMSSFPSEIGTQAGITTAAALMAWFIMPKLFHAFHRYVEEGPTSRLLKRSSQEKVPYDLSFWSALEDPAKILVTVIAFSQLGALVAPKTIAVQYIGPISKTAAVVSIIWFLQRWKSSAFGRLLSGRDLAASEKERFLALDKISSVGLLVLGGMSLAEAWGVAVQSIITVGGIGGVATAFAARDILGNMLSGFALQFAKPFSIGDTINAGSVEGQVVEIGLTATHLLNSDKFPVVVPNSFFSNQIIVNKSRAPWRLLSLKLPVNLKDYEKIPGISSNIKEMLRGHPNVFLEKEAPRCFISRVGLASFELSVICALKALGKDEALSTEQELILEAMRIVSESGASIGTPTSAA